MPRRDQPANDAKQFRQPVDQGTGAEISHEPGAGFGPNRAVNPEQDV